MWYTSSVTDNMLFLTEMYITCFKSLYRQTSALIYDIRPTECPPSAVSASSPGMTVTLWAYWGGMIALWLPNCEPGGSILISNRWRAVWGKVRCETVIESKKVMRIIKKLNDFNEKTFIFSVMIHLEYSHLALIQSKF